MAELVIDTLQYADRLEESGVGREQASAMSRALEEQLGERMPTKAEINERFNLVDTRFNLVDARFDRMDARFDAMDTRLDAMDTRFDALDDKLRLVVGVMIFGFMLLTGLGLFQSFRSVSPGVAGAVETQQPAVVSSSAMPTPEPTRTTVPTP